MTNDNRRTSAQTQQRTGTQRTGAPAQLGTNAQPGEEEDRYDLDQFLMAASDAQGHNARIYCRVMPMVAQQLEYVIQSKRFPYRTKGDIIRHAVHRHLGWLNGLEPEIKSVMGQVGAINAVLLEEQMADEFRAVFDRMGEQVNRFQGQGAEGEARRLILNILSMVGEMPDGYWRDRYMGEIKSRWGHLVESAPKASLLPV